MECYLLVAAAAEQSQLRLGQQYTGHELRSTSIDDAHSTPLHIMYTWASMTNKLVPWGTDGRLFATHVFAKFKVM